MVGMNFFAEQWRCSEPEPAGSAADKSNLSGGWPRSLTLSLGITAPLNMSDNIGDYLISTCFDFGGHDIRVTVTHDGYSHWFDASPVRDLNKAHPGYTVLARAVDADKAKHLERIENEYTLKALVPEEGLRKIREELSPRYWADKPGDDAILDAILEPIFWEHIAPYLSPPVTR